MEMITWSLQFLFSLLQNKIESQGPRFELNDFVIKLGNVTMNTTFKGVLIEASID